MIKNATFKLSTMMFLYYASLGLITPMISAYLMGDYLGFSGEQAGFIIGLEALAVIVSPLVGAFITDRWISAEFLLGIFQLLAGAIMLMFPFLTSFSGVLVALVCYNLLFIPGTALTNAITFHHSPNGAKKFGGIRVWGTVGWIFSGWSVLLVSLMMKDFDYRFFFLVSGIMSLGLGLFSMLALRKKTIESALEEEIRDLQPHFSGWKKIFPMEAFRFVFKKEILLVFFIAVLVKLGDRYYYFGCSPFLESQGISQKWIPALMSLGQISEIFLLVFLGRLIDKIGFKWVLFIGVLAEVFRFTFLATSTSVWTTLLAFPFHGIAFACFSSTVYIYINEGTTRKSRAGVQHLYALTTGTTANFFGAMIPGAVLANSQTLSQVPSNLVFWTIPGLMALVAASLVFLLPKKKKFI